MTVGNIKFRGVLALGVVFQSSRSSMTANHLCVIPSICVHVATPEVPSVSSFPSDCAIIEVICAVCEVPVLCQIFQSSDVAFKCVVMYQPLFNLFVLMYTCVYRCYMCFHLSFNICRTSNIHVLVLGLIMQPLAIVWVATLWHCCVYIGTFSLLWVDTW